MARKKAEPEAPPAGTIIDETHDWGQCVGCLTRNVALRKIPNDSGTGHKWRCEECAPS